MNNELKDFFIKYEKFTIILNKLLGKNIFEIEDMKVSEIKYMRDSVRISLYKYKEDEFAYIIIPFKCLFLMESEDIKYENLEVKYEYD
jgi:hypothetical protein